jgi:hypothetical protein
MTTQITQEMYEQAYRNAQQERANFSANAWKWLFSR